MQRKGIPRSYSNASYFKFHVKGGASVLPTVQGRKTVPGPSRLRQRCAPSGGAAAVGAIGSISVATVGRGMAMLAIFFVTATILKNVVYGSSATEELEMDAMGGGLRNNYWQTLDEQKLPLSEYPSIQYALDHSDVVLLYFAAAWCGMSTPITQLLDDKFGDILLPPEDRGSKLTNRVRRPISLVYVSSDKSEEEMIKYTRKNWIDVPFESQERTALKRHFKVCAKPEIPILNIDRMYEIPTIVVVSGASHNVLTMNGVGDLKEKGAEAMIHWIKLLHANKALEDNYY